MLNPLIISAPFGNRFDVPGVTSTLGTFTRYARRTGCLNQYDERCWWFGMLCQAVRTIRYKRKLKGWVNRMGLRNPGIRSIEPMPAFPPLVSIHGFCYEDWWVLLQTCLFKRVMAVELNFSCPNVAADGIATALEVLQIPEALSALFKQISPQLIAKLPPIDTVQWAEALLGAHPNLLLHCCNTTPCEYGGLSGQQHYSLIADLRKRFPDARLIAGGGISELYHIRSYLDAGANHVAVGSMLFKLRNWKKLVQFRDALVFHQ